MPGNTPPYPKYPNWGNLSAEFWGNLLRFAPNQFPSYPSLGLMTGRALFGAPPTFPSPQPASPTGGWQTGGQRPGEWTAGGWTPPPPTSAGGWQTGGQRPGEWTTGGWTPPPPASAGGWSDVGASRAAAERERKPAPPPSSWSDAGASSTAAAKERQTATTGTPGTTGETGGTPANKPYLANVDMDWYNRFTAEHGGITPEQYGWGTPEENLAQNIADRALQEAYVLAHGPDYMKMQALVNRTNWLMPPDRWQTALYLRRALGREPTVPEIDAAWSRANGIGDGTGGGFAGGYFQNIVPWYGPYSRWYPPYYGR